MFRLNTEVSSLKTSVNPSMADMSALMEENLKLKGEHDSHKA